MVDYGTDLSCVFDLDPGLAEVTGNVLMGQACARRLTTPRGTLIDDPNYGYDIRQFLNDDLSPSDLAKIGAQCDQELLKDERVVSSTTTITLVGNVLTASSVVFGANGPFTNVVTVSALTTTLLTAPQ